MCGLLPLKALGIRVSSFVLVGAEAPSVSPENISFSTAEQTFPLLFLLPAKTQPSSGIPSMPALAPWARGFWAQTLAQTKGG